MHTGIVCLLVWGGAAVLAAQDPPARTPPAPAAQAKAAPRTFTSFPVPAVPPLDVARATHEGIAAMLALQEGDDHDQWPYEGVYREDRGLLPVGYRVGGTAIACLGLCGAPGYAKDEARQQAVARGLHFVLKTLEHPRMQEGFVGTYDVRGWGHVFALELLLYLQDGGLVPAADRAEVETRTKWLVETLCASAIPGGGGWNYSRPKGYRSPANTAATFMTAPALQALFHAQARGLAVDPKVVTEALDALDRSRSRSGGFAYGAPAQSRNDKADEQLGMMDKTPSAAARASACETTLLLAGRGDLGRLRAAIDLFFAHWDDLAVRKSQTGTHVKPYWIAPYFFLYGHLYVAQAIEQLPDEADRRVLREKLLGVLALSREEDGSWNDRQFGRSGGYGTALAILVMHMAELGKPAAWTPPAPAASGAAK